MYVKKTNSKLMAVLLSLLMFFSDFSVNVFAEGENGGVITSFTLDDSYKEQSILVGDEEEPILPEVLTATLEDETTIDVEVTWNSDKEFSTETVGDVFYYTPTVTDESYTYDSTVLPVITVTIISEDDIPDNDTDPIMPIDENGITRKEVSTATELKNALNLYDNTNIKLTADFTTISGLAVKGTKVLDLNGHKLSGSYGITINDSGNFTVEDNTTDKKGSIETRNCRTIVVNRSATLTLNSGKLYSYWTTGVNSDTVYLAGQNSNVIINNGTVEAGGSQAEVFMFNSSSAKLTINDGYFRSRNSYFNWSDSGSCVMEINGGYFQSDFYSYRTSATITGGYFKTNVSSYVNSYYECVKTSDSNYPYTVQPKYQAELIQSGQETGVKYATLREALNDATDNSTVKLLRTISNYDTNECTVSAKNVTLNLNGYTAYISNNPINVTGSLILDGSVGSIYVKDTSAFEVASGATLTIKKGSIVTKTTTVSQTNVINVEGTLNLEDKAKVYAADLGNYNKAAKTINAMSGSTVNIRGSETEVGLSTLTSSTADYTYGVYADNATVNITGGTIKTKNGPAITGVNGAQITVKDTTVNTKLGAGLDISGTNSKATLSDNNNFYSNAASGTGYILYPHDGATLEVSDGTYRNNDTYNTWPKAVYVGANTTVTISGGKFINTSSSEQGATVFIGNVEGANVNITGGSFLNNKTNATQAFNVYSQNKDNVVHISGGYFYTNNTTNGDIYPVLVKTENNVPKYNIEITGGKFRNRGFKSTAYNNQYSLDLMANGKAIKSINETVDSLTYLYEIGNPVASITINGVTTSYASLQDAINAADGKNEATVKLLSNVSEDVTVSKAKVTLDLNGHNIQADTDKSVTGTVTFSAANTKLVDSSTEGTKGSIPNVVVNSTTTIEDVSITKLTVGSSGSVGIQSGSVSSIEKNGKVAITGGTFGFIPDSYISSKGLYESNQGEDNKYTVSIKKEPTVTTFNEFKIAMESEAVTKVTVDGSFTMTDNVTSVGTKELVVNSGKPITNNAKNTSTPYTIYVGDGENEASLTLSGDGTIYGNYGEAFNVKKNGTLNVTGGNIMSTATTSSTTNTVVVDGGTLNVSGGSITSSTPVAGNANSTYAVVYVAKGSTVNVTGGKIQADYNKASWRKAISVQSTSTADDTKVTISGEDTKIGGNYSAYDILSQGGATVSVTGGTFAHTFGSATYNNKEAFLSSDKVIKDCGSGVTDNLRYQVVDKNGDAIVIPSGKTEAEGTKYESLKAALLAAEEGSTVKLLRDSVNLNSDACEVKNNITLDLNGYTAQIINNPITVSGTLTIKDETGKGGIQSSIVNATSTSVSYSGQTKLFVVNSNGTLTIENGNFTQNCGFNSKSERLDIVTVNTGGTFNFKNGTLNCGDYCSGVYMVYAEGVNTFVNIDGGTFNCYGNGFYIKNNATFNMTDGTVNGFSDGVTIDNATGNLTGKNIMFNDTRQLSGKVIYVKSNSTLNISGGSYVRKSAYSNSSYSLYLESQNEIDSTKATGNTVNISGGTFQSYYPALYCAGVNSRITISGGYFSASNSRTVTAGQNYLTVTGGTFTYGNSTGANIYGSNTTIYGGLFSTYTCLSEQTNGTTGLNTLLAKGYTYKEVQNTPYYRYKVGPKANGQVSGTKATTTDSNGETHEWASLEDAINNSEPGSTIKLDSDATLTSPLTITKDLTIDLNGKTISKSTESGSEFTGSTLININDGSHLTITDSTDEANGKIEGNGVNAITVGSSSEEGTSGAQLTLDKGTIQSTDDNNTSDVIVVKGANSNVTINDGSVKATGSSTEPATTAKAISIDTGATNATVTVNGGELSSKAGSVIDGGSTSNTVTINDGTLTNQVDGGTNKNNLINNGTTQEETTSPTFNVVINGGKFNSGKATGDQGSELTDNIGGAVTTKENVTLTGGEFSTNKNISDILTSDSKYTLSTNEDTTDKDTYPYAVTANYEATLTKADGTQETGTLADLLSKAEDGNTITLNKNLSIKTGDNPSTLTIDKNITLDLGGHTLSSEVTGSTVTVSDGKNVTIKNGNITNASGTAQEGTPNTSISVGSDSTVTLGNGENGEETPKLTVGKVINNGTLDVTKGATTGEIISKDKSTTNIKGGTVTDDDTDNVSIDGEKGSTINIISGKTGDIKTEGTVNVTGGKTGDIDANGSDSKVNVSDGTVGKGKDSTSIDSEGTTNISGGTIEGKVATSKGDGSSQGGDTDITGGTVKGDVDTGSGSKTDIEGGEIGGNVTGDGTSNITGGTFKTKPTLKDDKYVVEETTGADGSTQYNVIPKDSVVATIGSGNDTKYYSSIQNAVDNATDNATIQLSKDIPNANIVVDKNLTFDLNGHTITAASGSNAITAVDNGGAGEGSEGKEGTAITVTVKDTNTTKKGSVLGSQATSSSSDNKATIDISNSHSGSKVVIDGVTVTGSKGADSDTGNGSNGTYAINAGTNSVEIKGNAVVTGGDGGDATGTTGEGGEGSTAICYKKDGTDTGTNEAVANQITIADGSTVQSGKNGLGHTAFTWKNDYADIINKQTVTNDDLGSETDKGIVGALAAYDKLDSAVKEKFTTEKTILDNKKKAAEWYRDNVEAINATTPLSSSDASKVISAYEALMGDGTDKNTGLGTDVSQYISQDLRNALKAKYDAAKYEQTHSNALSDSISSIKSDDLTKLSTAIDNAINAYKNLSKEAKEAVDDGAVETDCSDSTTVKNLNAKKDAIDFLKNSNWNELLNKDTKDLTSSDYSKLKDALDAYNNLSDTAKDFMPESVTNLMDSVSKAKTWEDNNNNILSKKTSTADPSNGGVTDGDLYDIKKALNLTTDNSEDSSKKLDDIAQALVSDKKNQLDKMKEAAEWYEKNLEAITTSAPLTTDTAKKVLDADKTLNGDGTEANKGLSDDVKAYVPQAAKTAIEKKKEAAKYLDDYGYKKTVDTTTGVTRESGVIGKNPVTADDVDTLTKALEDLLKLKPSGSSTNDDSYTYAGGEPLKNDLTNQKSAAEFLNNEKWKDALKKPLSELTSDDYKAIAEAKKELERTTKNDKGEDVPVYSDDVKNYIDDSTLNLIDNSDSVQSWADENKDILGILDKNTGITDADLDDIQIAIDSIEKLDLTEQEALKSTLDSLKAKKEVAEWYKANKDIIEKNDTITPDDKAAIDKATAYKKVDGSGNNTDTPLTEAQKKYIGDDVLNNLAHKKAISDFIDTYTYKTTDQGTSGIIGKTPITAADAEAINDAYDAYKSIDKALTNSEKNLLPTETIETLKKLKKASDFLTDDTWKDELTDTNLSNKSEDDLDKLLDANDSYQNDLKKDGSNELLEDSVKDLMDHVDNVAEWIEHNKTIIDKDSVDGSDTNYLNNALKYTKDNSNDENSKLTDDEKRLINKTIDELNDKKAVVDWFNQFKDILDDSKQIDNLDDVTRFNEAMNAYDQLDDSKKAYVSKENKDKLESKKEASEWITNNNDLINKGNSVTGDDKDSLKKSIDDYNNLDDTAKSYVGDEAIKTIIDQIKTVSPSTKEFIDKYFSDGTNDYTSVTKDNYQKILSSKDAYNALDEETKSLVEAILKAETGKSYEELYSEAQKMKDDIDKASKTANTSDTTNITTPIVIFSFALLSALLLFFYRRRQSSN